MWRSSLSSSLIASLPLLTGSLLLSPIAAAQEQARMTLNLLATGTDSTRSEGEWSKGTFRYRLSLSTIVETDGELLDVNLYDPEYAAKALAQAEAAMARIQAARNGQFSDEEEVEPDYRYLFYTAELDCPLELSIEVEERVEGEYADVGGMQPYTVTFTGSSAGNEAERAMLCLAGTGVLDVKDEVFYRSGIGFPEVTGHYVYNEANRGSLQDNPDSRQAALPRVLSDHLEERLRVAPMKGQEKATLRPTEPVLTRINAFGDYEGQVELELSWDFERLD